MEEYITGIKASKILGVHKRTLYNWDKQKTIETIRTPGGKRLYNVKKFLMDNNYKFDITKKILFMLEYHR